MGDGRGEKRGKRKGGRGRIVNAIGLSEEEKEKVLGGNLMRLIERR